MQYIHSKEEFEQALKDANGIILADFFATWCWPCKMIAPILEEISREHPEITVLKIDVDEVQDLAQEYEISSIPTIYIWKNHELTDWYVGAYPKDFYEQKIQSLS